jgi:signal peptidase I
MLLNEPYIKQEWHDTRPKVTIPEGQYYVLGDNRDNSLDSRSPQVGLIPLDLMVGKASLTYWPFDKLGLAPNGGTSLEEPTLTTTRIGQPAPQAAAAGP